MNSNFSQPYSVYRREGTTNWWVRFSIKGEGQIRRSLETADEAEARHKAHEIWYEAQYRAKNGLKAKPSSFAKVAEEFIALVEREAERGERPAYHARDIPPVVQRYFISYFGTKDISSITEADIEKYLEWRKEYWLTGPGAEVTHITYERNGKTIKRPLSEKRMPTLSRQKSETVTLRQLFRQAVKWGYMNNGQVPDIAISKPGQPNHRPSFEPQDFKKLIDMSLKRLSDPDIHEHLRWDRTILHSQIMIAAYSGMRPTEMKNLNWGDVLGYREGRKLPIGKRDIRLRVHGKAKSRTFVPQEAALPWFDRLWDFWVQHVGKSPKDSDPVFATRDGKRLGSTKKALSELLKACDLLVDYRSVRRTSYSFRHYYISQQLAHGVDVFPLARNTGTSPDMIHKFYGQVTNERMKDHLRPEWKDV